MWILTLFELARDKFEQWELDKLRESLRTLELEVPLEAKIAEADIEAMHYQTEIEGNKTEVVKAQTREIKGR